MSPLRPLVSIVIVNYNTVDLTIQCIKSIENNSKYEPIEIIVVDNASKESVDHVPKLFPNVKLLKSQENLGFARGNNLGIEAAKGELILLLNSDAELVNDAVEVCVKSLTSDDKVAVIAPRLIYPDGKVQHNCQRFPSIRYKLFELLRMQKVFRKAGGKVLLGSFFDYNSPAYVDWVWGTFFMFPKQLLSVLPGKKLDDSFFMYCEDMEWCMQFKKRGYKILYNPAALVLHHMGMSKGNKNLYISSNTQVFMARHYSKFHQRMIALFGKFLQVTL
jgi:GT2 family glycosyltransferase